MRVLVVDDHAALREALRDGLGLHGFVVDTASNGEEGLRVIETKVHDAVVLALVLPGLSGFAVLTRIRATGSKVPVLALVDGDAVEDRIRALEIGADQCMVKPCLVPELAARLRALVRRYYNTSRPILRIEDLEIDTIKKSVSRGGRSIALSPREYVLLEYLAIRAGELVTRNAIRDHVYGPDAVASSNIIDVYVAQLRKKLGPPSLLHARRGYGYTLGPG